MDITDEVTGRLKQWALDVLNAIVEIFAYPFATLALVRAAAAAEAQSDLNQIRASYQTVPLDPSILAEMVMREILGIDQAATEAAMSSLDLERFKLMVLSVGEPPGLMEMVSLWRRGLITEDELDKAIVYSRVRNDWIPQLKLMAYDTMSQSDALEAAVKGVLDPAAAKELFIQAGGLADQWQTLLDTSGNAIGVQQVEELWLHGLATPEDVKRTILHSRINPTFEPLAAELYHHYLTSFQIKNIVEGGGATVEQATEWLIQTGLPADQAAAFVKAVAKGTSTKVHDISESQVLELYESHFIDQDEAKALLTHLGYDQATQTYLLEILDSKRALAALTAGVTYIKKAYIAGIVSDNDARIKLGALEVPNAAIEAYLAAWAVEKATEFKQLTAAQIGTAYKDQFISEADALGRWAAMGYSETDAAILLALHGGAAPAGSPAAAKQP